MAVPSTGDDLRAPVDPRFGRCKRFILVDTSTMGFGLIDNTAASSSGGAGIAAAQLVIDAGTDAVVANEVGPNAMRVLEAAGIRVVTGVKGTVEDAVRSIEPAGGE